MVGLAWLEYPLGATPLDPDESEGLIPTHISTQQQLNEWELLNILEAQEKVLRFNQSYEHILTLHFSRSLHKYMFSNTWKWAGILRQSNKNIGVDWQNIASRTKVLLDDVKYQIENATYSRDEIASRFHHRLVAIHLFSNGNGRHARLMKDLLLQALGHEKFTWGNINLSDMTNVRKNYIEALRKADQHDYEALLQFVRS
jgi:Fic-DOC domain mobile mystery protein B